MARCIARDPKLKREVATKLLSEEFSAVTSTET